MSLLSSQGTDWVFAQGVGEEKKKVLEQYQQAVKRQANKSDVSRDCNKCHGEGRYVVGDNIPVIEGGQMQVACSNSSRKGGKKQGPGGACFPS